MKSPYLTLEESQALMAKGLTTNRRSAINYVHKKIEDRDLNEMGVTDESYTKGLAEIAYEITEQRDELLDALNSVSAWSESLNRTMPTWLESKVDDAVTNAEK